MKLNLIAPFLAFYLSTRVLSSYHVELAQLQSTALEQERSVASVSPALSKLLLLLFQIERFSFEYRKTKTKVITVANHKGHRQYSEPIKTRSNYM